MQVLWFNGKPVAYTPCLKCRTQNKLTWLRRVYEATASVVFAIYLLLSPVAICAYFEVLDFSEKAKRDWTDDIRFEEGSPKWSFRKNKMNYEVLNLSTYSRYLWTGAHMNIRHLNMARTKGVSSDPRIESAMIWLFKDEEIQVKFQALSDHIRAYKMATKQLIDGKIHLTQHC